ncbi:MAG: DUF2807 domain-containing protein [Flavobacteriales bacterium]|nr:DUF2807 domain-containing protein [Flavobacteriales bacterium]
MQRLPIPFWGLFLFVAAGCSGEGAGCWTPQGDATAASVSLDVPMEAVQIVDRIDVEWLPTAGPEGPRLTWHTGEGLIEGMSAELQDGTLLIQDLNRCRWVRPLDAVPKVRIEGVDCRNWLLEGQGSFSMVDTLYGGDLRVTGDEMSGPMQLLFHGDTLQVRLPNGIGHLAVSGQARRLRAFRAGFGDLDARHLDAHQAMVHHGGLGDLHLNAANYLYLEVAGAGNTYLHQEPEESNIQFLDGAVGTVTLVP